MGKVVRLDSWEEFESEVSVVFEKMKSRKIETKEYISSLLFRGQAQECWKLTTTLERGSPNQEYSISDYHRLMRNVEPTVASLTSKSWELPRLDEPENIDKDMSWLPQGLDFMVYLRHYGFPSPLLDWTRSPYVAAFFAFHSCRDNKDENVAIYSYIEIHGCQKTFSSKGMIRGIGPCIITDKRHYIQQCEYTICKKKNENRYIYSNHEEVFQNNKDNQDILTKFLIPASERSKVLARLDLMNINSYSLFGDEDNLMKTLAYREIEASAN